MNLSSHTVFLARCLDYEEQALAECCDRLLSACLAGRNLNSVRVMLKPNLITANMGALACTEGRFMLAAAKWFLDQNAKVAIGDSPAFGSTARELKKLGVAEALRSLGVSIVDFNHVRQVTLPSGLCAGMAAEALDCDMLVNMPRVKAHQQMRVSLAVKNLFGCLMGMRKPFWHMVHGGKCGRFADHLAELLSILPDGITIVDGITAMHQSGPMLGKPYPLQVIGCSSNPVAMDRALLSILGVEPELSPLMQSCIKKGMNGVELDSLNFPMLTPGELRVNTFVVPEELHPVRFSLYHYLRGTVKRILLKLGVSR